MNNSRVGQPQTLSLTKPDFISHNMPRNGFTTSVSVETSSVKPESSIEFDIPEGASPLARFGMDIGGTLCKVVYFEPARPLYSSCMKHVVNTMQDDTTRLVEGKGSLFESEKPSEDEYTGQTSLNGEETHKQFDTSFAQSIARTENDVHIEIKPASGKLQEPLNKLAHQITNAEGGRQGNCSQGCMNFNGTRTSLGAPSGERPKERVHSTSYPISNIRKIWLSSNVPVDLPGRGTLHFKCFETWRIEEFLKLSREHSLVTPGRAIGATGGGARKFFDKFFDIAGLRLQHYDELKSLVRGIDFLVRNAQHESFEYPMGSYKAGLIQRPWKSPENSSDDDDNNSCHRENGRQNVGNKNITNVHSDEDGIENCDGGQNARTIAESCVPKIDGNSVLLDGSQNLYPYLVVNIGSGVGILRVDSPDKFQRVGGTSLGGSTFLGLASALTGCNSFEEAVNLAMRGDSTQIDMLVGDIYGGDYTEMGLAATTVASSFGKLVEPAKRDAAMKTPEHLAKATLLMITNNIGSIAMLHSRAAGVDHVLFTGSFLRGNKVATRLLAVAMEFWSKGLIKAIFLRHEGHAGAVGAMLYGLDPTSEEDAILLV